ncbi:MAG: tRNA dihydrouridine synthase DusB [Calditrichaeota bacterium]|nr:tRNA dihydrouridine synthase DusB [Calditrichota bacterium]MCB9366279.1 tRNA dihydrouridine synthase DusB [Calditrichota bacterium]MCB9391651.1 tRNA dihydrouridine synthase DusB [Calditrichota bacterium]
MTLPESQPASRNPLRTQLGPIEIERPVVLAPLAGWTDTAMRRISRRYGAGVVFSEMLSGEGVRRKNEKTRKMAGFAQEERPYFIQYFATSPEQAADAAKRLAELEPDGLDLNFGCPVKKIILNQGGAALLKDVGLLGRIVEAAAKAVSIPVSVKMRSGWDHRSLNAVEVARTVESAGAAWVTVHARTRNEFFQGRAHWEWIGEVKSSVRIPVIGNGDVRTAEDVHRLLDMTHCDAVMIGRGAMGYPFIFREVDHYLRVGHECPAPTPRERLDASEKHLEWLIEFFGDPRRATLEFRKHLLAYSKGLHGSARFKREAMSLLEPDAVRESMRSFYLSLPDHPVARPLSAIDEAPVWC